MDTGGGRTDWPHGSSRETKPLLEVGLQAVLVQAEPIEEAAERVGRQLLHGGLHLVAAAGGGAGEGVAPASVFLQTGPAEAVETVGQHLGVLQGSVAEGTAQGGVRGPGDVT